MKVMPIATPGALSKPALGPLQEWVVGQLLDVTVIGPSDKNSTRLRIDGAIFETASAATLAPGQKFVVQVKSAGSLPVLTPLPQPPTHEVEPTSVLNRGLNLVLPRQQPLAGMYQALGALATSLNTPAPSGEPVTAQILQLVQQIETMVANAPTLVELSNPADLKRALTNTGIHLEATLAQVTTSQGLERLPNTDLKWRALTLLRATDLALEHRPESIPARVTIAARTAPELSSSLQALGISPQPQRLAGVKDAIEAVVARITTHQLQIAEAANNGMVYGTFEIPVTVDQGIGSVLINVERDLAGEHSDYVAPTTVMVRVPLGDDRELRARLTLSDLHVAMSVWSDDPATREMIARHQHILQRQLERCGLQVDRLTVAEVAPVTELARQPLTLVDARV
ncbi:MAG: flagellar hook-length control protein FliK [Gammaproteobacteria bacterium]|nr:flagellar hook-length control protein FliK [Gammaproteobacteria bacterium]